MDISVNKEEPMSFFLNLAKPKKVMKKLYLNNVVE